MKKLWIGLLVGVCAAMACAAPVEVKLVPDAWNGHCKQVEMEGETGWQSERWKELGSRYFFFDVKDPAFKNGQAPELEITLTYFDTFAAPITLQYDSTDSSATKEGAFKNGKTFQARGKGGLQTVSWIVSDARFANHCGTHDFRIAIGKNVDFIIKEVVVQPAGGSQAPAPVVKDVKRPPGFFIPEVFSDNMVLPHDKPVPVWGWADDGTVVTVSFNEYDLESTARNGKWQVIFPPMKASQTPQTMTVSTDSDTPKIQYVNVLIGDTGSELPGYDAFLKKAGSGQLIRICYLGGSITCGASTAPRKGINRDGKPFDYSDYDVNRDSWRAITYQWLKDTYEVNEGQFEEVNAAIGATTSELAAFRLKDDVLAYKPDLLFIEFAVNDAGQGILSADDPQADRSIQRTLANIISRVRMQNPDIAIFSLVTTHRKNRIAAKAHWCKAQEKISSGSYTDCG
jgi:hypothetical protein